MYKLKNILLVGLLFISTLSFSQKTITWYRITSDTTQLNYNPFSSTNTIKTGYYNINPITGEQRRYVGSTSWVVDSLFKSSNKKDTVVISNKDTIVISNKDTILSITKDTVYLSGNILNTLNSEYTPEQYGAIRANQTFAQRGIIQDTINVRYPGMGFTTSDYIDWAAWQMAVKMATLNGGGVRAKGGTYYIGSKSILIEKNSSYFQIDGNYAKLISTGNTPIITRVSPTSSSDAIQMNNLRCTIRNLVLQGTSSQIGIDIGPTYGAYYQNVMGVNLLTCIHVRFGLRTTIDNCMATNCVNGWIADKGNWTGATSSNSQSNHTTFRSCRYFGAGDVAIGVYYSSGCVVEDCIIEGTSVRVGVDFNGFSSTVVKDFTIRNTHFECPSGASEAFIKVRMHSGVVTIDKVFGQYASILADIGATVGFMTAQISHVSYWVAKNGKHFNNAGNVGWILEYNELPLVTTTPSTTVPTWFDGTTVQNCGGPGCGSNRFTYIGIPR